MFPIKAIIFDMDGVLIDAKEWHYEAFNMAIGMFGHTINRFEHTSRYDGLPTREKLRLLTHERGFPRELHGLVNTLKQQYTLEIAEQRCRPNLGHQRTLMQLKQDGYLIGLASNSIRNTVDILMRKGGLHDMLAFTLSNEDVRQAKPAPEIYLRAMELAGTAPHETLVVEDNAHGVAAAEAAGAHVLQVNSVDDVNYSNIRSRLDSIERNRFRRAG